MPHKGKITVEEKVKTVETYLSGKIGFTSAYTSAGVTKATLRRWLSRYRTDGAAGFLPQKRNRRYTKETKIAAVKDYLSGQGSMHDICERYGIRHSRQLGNWVMVYNRHEEFRIQTGGASMTKSRPTTFEERVQIVRDCVKVGNDYGGTAIKHSVSYQQVYTWMKKYREMGEAGLEDRRGRRTGTMPSRTPEEELRDRVAQLERKNYDLEMENALLKKVRELERRRR